MDRYQVFNVTECRKRKLPGYEDEPTPWDRYASYYVLWEVDDSGAPIREVFCDRMEPEDATLVRDLRPLVAELNWLYEAWQDQKAM